MKTIMADFTSETALLFQGIKGKINERGEIQNGKTLDGVSSFADAFKKLIPCRSNG